jgi:NADPH-dependent curcumin reductase CurA
MAETIALTRLENAPVAFRGLLEGRTFGTRVVRVAEA